MRALLRRSRLARAAAALSALAIVLPLVQGAVAGGDVGLRRDTFHPGPGPELRLSAVAAPVRHRLARRIWAASRLRPLRVALARPARRPHPAAAHPAPGRVAASRPFAEPQVVFPKLTGMPKPPRPALVSIYEDRTLRAGDAVMMADGVHVFHGTGAWPHQPREFVRLTFAAALDWHLRQSLDAFDRNPPTRWTSSEAAAG